MSERFSEVRYLADCYRRASLRARAHVYGRWVLCPFDRVLENLPRDGDHLDVGCGHGVLLTLMRRRSSSQRLKGIDISFEKIEQARRVTSPDISFEVGDVRALGPASFDSISVVDVLYLLSVPQRLDFLRACHFALRPGGTLVVKEVSRVSSWKSWLTFLQEFLAVKVFRVTMGEEVLLLPTQHTVSLIVEAGFSTPEVKQIDRGYPYPHTLFRSQKAAA
jgi:cyclopropane-fatty-acyl-phospholipid synthase